MEETKTKKGVDGNSSKEEVGSTYTLGETVSNFGTKLNNRAKKFGKSLAKGFGIGVMALILLNVLFSLLSGGTSYAEREYERSKFIVEAKAAELERAEYEFCLADKEYAKEGLEKFYADELELTESEKDSFSERAEQDCKEPVSMEGEATASLPVDDDVYPLHPEHLYYFFAKKDGISSANISQTWENHEGPYTALDISTNKEYKNLYAPSYVWFDKDGNRYDEAREYTVKVTENYNTMGLAIELYWKDTNVWTGHEVEYSWVVGHVKEAWVEDGQKVVTGERIGSSGGCIGDLKMGEVSTGCHAHIEFRLEGGAIKHPEIRHNPHGEKLIAWEKYQEKAWAEKLEKSAPLTAYLKENADPILHDKGVVFYDAGTSQGITPELLVCIVQADTSGGKSLKSKNNVGNVGNNDRGDTREYETIDDAIYAVGRVLNNDLMGGNVIVGELSGNGLAAIRGLDITKDPNPCIAQSMPNKCYASSYGSSGFWNANVISCLSDITGEDVDESYYFRF